MWKYIPGVSIEYLRNKYDWIYIVKFTSIQLGIMSDNVSINKGMVDFKTKVRLNISLIWIPRWKAIVLSSNFTSVLLWKISKRYIRTKLSMNRSTNKNVWKSSEENLTRYYLTIKLFNENNQSSIV